MQGAFKSPPRAGSYLTLQVFGMNLKELTLDQLRQLEKDCRIEIDLRIKMQEINHKKSQREREDRCDDHEYVPTNAKWGGANEMRCINCGKTIN